MKKIEELKAKILGLFKKKPLVMPDQAPAAAQTPAVTPEGTVILGKPNTPAITPEGTMILPKSTPAPAAASAGEAHLPSSVIPAGFGLRFLARWIDTNLLLILGVLPVIFLQLPFGVINFVLPFLYFGILHGLKGQTLGKKIIGIKLVKEGGSPVGFPMAFVRALADWLNILTLCVGYLLAIFTSKKQALHDIVCKTQVGLVQPCPMWVAIVSFVAPPLAWTAVILTVGLSMFAAIAGPLMALKSTGGVIQPTVNININAEQTENAADQKQEGTDEEFPEDEPAAAPEQKPVGGVTPASTSPEKSRSAGADKVPPAAPVVKAVVVEEKPAPKAEPKPEVKKPEALKPPEMKKIEPVKETPRNMTVRSSKPAPSGQPPVTTPETAAAIEEAVSLYLTAKDSSVSNLNVSVDASDEMRRGVAKASYEIAGKKASSRLLVLNFADGWGVARPLTSNEILDWSTGKIIQ